MEARQEPDTEDKTVNVLQKKQEINRILRGMEGLQKSYKKINTYSGRDKGGSVITISFYKDYLKVHKQIYRNSVEIKKVAIEDLKLDNFRIWINCLFSCINPLDYQKIEIYLTDYKGNRKQEK